MKDYDIPKSKCVGCGYETEGATNAFGSRRPKPGDISVCLMCGHLTAFNADMTPRPLTDDEMVAIAGDKRLLRIQEARGRALKGSTK